MKKIFPLLLLTLAFVSCNKEGTYKKALDGNWELYKYLYRNADRTTQFQSDFPGYMISFTKTGTFSEQYAGSPDTIRTAGAYSFSDDDTKIILAYTGYKTVDTVQIPYDILRAYTIFNLTSAHVQLRNDSTELYLRKLE